MSRNSFHSWCCKNCSVFHETYGSRTDASTYSRECPVGDHEACTSCLKPCVVCAGGICTEHAIEFKAELYCHTCALDTLGILREELTYTYSHTEQRLLKAEIAALVANMAAKGLVVEMEVTPGVAA